MHLQGNFFRIAIILLSNTSKETFYIVRTFKFLRIDWYFSFESILAFLYKSEFRRKNDEFRRKISVFAASEFRRKIG